MIKIVLDTNIIISAALSPNGNPNKIFLMANEDENFTIRQMKPVRFL
jgi:predicted nucleic acid-binding protein